jgi:hypothetical protein
MTPDDPRLPPPDDRRPARPGSAADDPAAGHGDTDDDWRRDTDELASALLDGMLDDASAAAARQRADVMARLAEIASARAALRDAPTPAPVPVVRERAIAAALDAFDDEAATPPAPARRPDGDVASRRSRRPAPRRVAPRWLGAAAAAALLVAAAAGLAAVGTGDNDDAETSGAAVDAGSEAEEAEEEASGGVDAPAADEGTDDDAGEFAPAVPLVAGDLGSFASVDDVVADLRTRAAAEGGTGATDGSDEAAARPDDALADLRLRCGTELPGSLDDDGTVVRLRGTATLQGDPVDVLVIRTADGDRVVVLDAACGLVADEPLG